VLASQKVEQPFKLVINLLLYLSRSKRRYLRGSCKSDNELISYMCVEACNCYH